MCEPKLAFSCSETTPFLQQRSKRREMFSSAAAKLSRKLSLSHTFCRAGWGLMEVAAQNAWRAPGWRWLALQQGLQEGSEDHATFRPGGACVCNTGSNDRGLLADLTKGRHTSCCLMAVPVNRSPPTSAHPTRDPWLRSSPAIYSTAAARRRLRSPSAPPLLCLTICSIKVMAVLQLQEDPGNDTLFNDPRGSSGGKSLPCT